jgi:diguanylate cyclase (GGDEF)-like protein
LSDQQPLIDEHDLPTLGREPRTVLSKRLCIRGEGGEPRYLLVVIDDITQQKEADAKIAHLAFHDALTGLPNRVLFRDRLEQELAYVRRGASLALHYLDLDHFKGINDTLGHSLGDELLKAVSHRLQGCLRECDLVARLGGDEFAVIQTGLAESREAAVLAQRLRDEVIREPYDLRGHHVVVDASIGIALSPGDGSDAEQLLSNADMALYQAKAEGRGGYRYFEPDMDARMKRRRMLEIDLRKALANDELEVHYQPVIRLQDNAVTGCEALLRWNHPDRAPVSPAEFIPIAEETGLIVPIGEWVLRQACTDAATWPRNLMIAVNLSPVQIKSSTFTLTVANILSASELAPQRLELEITEAVLMQSNVANLAVLHLLRDLGVRFAMDDFGTGYSSLSYLRSFPFDKIKIDQSFVRDLSKGADSQKIIQAIVALARGLGMVTTAEGVETDEQLAVLRAVGCDEIQGRLFSAAKPVSELAKLIRGKSVARSNVA